MKLRTAIIGIGLLLLAGPTAGQQNPAAPAFAFEVASIKPAPQLTMDMIRSGQLHVGINVKGTRADYGFQSLADLLPYAYRVKPYQIAGPDWMREARWDILGKLPDGESTDRAPEMMQALLAERFKLAVHRENREQPVYEMVAAKSGVKLQPSTPEEETPAAADDTVPVPGLFPGFAGGTSSIRVTNDGGGRGMVVSGGPNGTMRVAPGVNGGMRLEMSKVTMAALADMLTPFTDRTVVDRTGLQGSYQVTLDLPMEALMSMVQNAARTAGVAGLAGAGAAGNPFGGRGGGLIGGAGGGGLVPGVASDPSGASILRAVKALGLELQPRKAPVETIVVDHLEKIPTEN